MNTFKKRHIGIFICFTVMFLAMGSSGWAADCKATFGNSEVTFKLATGSPGELGMLEQLADAFNARHGTAMCWVKAGSGKSLKLLQDHKRFHDGHFEKSQ
jgi:tungstate transport system substrate-binding protein